MSKCKMNEKYEEFKKNHAEIAKLILETLSLNLKKDWSGSQVLFALFALIVYFSGKCHEKGDNESKNMLRFFIKEFNVLIKKYEKS